MFGITTKDKSAYFAGFTATGKAKWTSNKAKAWSDSRAMAACQSSLLKANGESVQLKPVAL